MNEQGTPSDIAIIGIGFKGPGAEDLEQLWDVLKNGKCMVVEIPKERWNVDAFYDPDPQKPGKYYSKRAGLLSNPYEFDHGFFNISEVESDETDPQQKLVLECTYRAMENAGITRTMLEDSKTGVYIGAMNCDYRSLFPVKSSSISNYTATGISNSIIAARVSYTFDLLGPAMVIDTGCSSALVAMHTASHALLQGDCSMAICGGINFIASPDIFVHLSKAQMLSPSGRCHAFSDQADGYTRGEGCGIVILKKLNDAEKAGDNILAIIKTGTNQDGHEVTPISAPSKTQQMKLLEDMYSGYSLEQINEVEYIEAHGTGTQAGDFAEAHALGEFFINKGSFNKRLIGSIKTNIGHLESAAGAAGVIKVLLMMKHNKIAPSLLCGELNKKIDFQKLNLKVVTELTDWTTEKKVASVNSFGFGGSNCHAIVKSYAPSPISITNKKDCRTKPCIVCFSGKNSNSLQGSMADFLSYPDKEVLDVHDMSFTSTIRRDHYKHRAAFVVESLKELTEKLQTANQKDDPSKSMNGMNIVFVFGGMGTAWDGMCKEFLAESDIFNTTINEIDECLGKFQSCSLKDMFMKGEVSKDILFSPIAIFACQVALAKLWLSLGVKPAYIVGQSVGEVAAACISGNLSLHDAVDVVYKRSLLLSRVRGGNMFIVKNLDIKQVKDVVNHYHSKANISVEYSPVSCAVSCEPDFVESIQKQLLEVNGDTQFTDLPVPTAYHSHRMDEIKTELSKELNSINPKEQPEFTMVSTVTGQYVKSALDAKYWEDNLREPVRFHAALRKTYGTNSSNIYIEIGPKPVLQAHVQDVFQKEKNIEALISMREKCELKRFLESVAVLYCRGYDINWNNMPQYGREITPIPRYCFQKRQGFFKSEAAILALSGVNYMRLQHPYVYSINTSEALVMISLQTFPSIYEHKISDMLIIPGAFYPEIGFALSKLRQDMKAPMYAVSAEFKQPFRLSREGPTVLRIECHKKPLNADGSKTIADRYTVHIKTDEATFATLEMQPLKILPKNCPTENIPFLKGLCPMKVTKEEIYSFLKAYGFTYGSRFSLLEKAYKSANQCLAYVTVPDSLKPELSGTTIHPSLIDSMIQATVILLDENEKTKELFPRSIGSLICYSSIQPNMYIIATKKGGEGDLSYYDIKLTSLNGRIVAIMKSLTHKTLAGRDQTIDSLYKCIWTKQANIAPRPEDRESRILVITDKAPALPEKQHSNCLVFNLMEQPWEVICSNISKINNTLDFILISMMSCDINDTDDSNIVLKKTLNLCLFLKELYGCVFNLRFQKPVFLFTKGAFDLEVENTEVRGHKINPILTSAWGLLRCSLREPLNDEMFAIDVHVRLEDITLNLLASVAEQIRHDPNLRSYPEFILTKEHLHVNQIVKLGNQTIVPNFRLNNADSNTNYLILSNQPETLTKTSCVYIPEIRSLTANDIEINISEAAIQNPNLYNVSVPYNEGHVDMHALNNQFCRRPGEDGFLVYVVEYCGEMLSSDPRKTNVVSCFPVPLASKVLVPKIVTISINMMYQYKLGDVTKLTVLMALCVKVNRNSVTVLASKTTFHLAQCLEIILNTLNTFNNINIVMIDQFTSMSRVNETVIALVVIDKNIFFTLNAVEEKPKQFIAIDTLLKDVKSLFSVTFPPIHLDLLDTSHLFSRGELINLVPVLTKWMTGHNAEIKSVLQILHGQAEHPHAKEKETLDLRKLFENECFTFSKDSLTVRRGDLFRKDSLYIIVGGLTGLGWLTVKYLAENKAGCIAILNRRPASDEHKRAIHEVCELKNCQIVTYKGDASKFKSVKNIMKSLNEKFPSMPLRGVFFSAAVLEDKPLLDMTSKNFYNVLLPKVKGVWNMHLATKDLALDYFVLYSSITSVVGNINQANYGAGNAFLDGLAMRRRSMNLAGQSINWGALDLGLLKGNLEARKTLESKGFLLMSEDDTRKALDPVLLLNLPLVMPCLLDEKIIFDRRALDTPMLLQSRLKTIFRGSATEGVKVQDDVLRELETIRDKPRDQRIQFFEKYICDLASQVLGLQGGTLKAESSLGDFGIDSIVAMTMINSIYRQTGCKVHAIVFLDGQATVNKIASQLDDLYSVLKPQNQLQNQPS